MFHQSSRFPHILKYYDEKITYNYIDNTIEINLDEGKIHYDKKVNPCNITKFKMDNIQMVQYNYMYEGH